MSSTHAPPPVQPAEWDEHDAVWSAWPSDADLWAEDLLPARAELAAFFRALAAGPKGGPRGDALKILACGQEAVASAEEALADMNAQVLPARFGDIWLRDTAPIFVRRGAGVAAARFKFNGWGGKYVLDGDEGVAEEVARRAGVPSTRHDFVLEGGSIDVDGRGTALTTRQCLLNPNRNPALGQAELEQRLRASLGIRQLIWLGDGLANDHTDGHIDNIARFVAPGVVVCMEPSGSDDPNAAALRDILDTLRDARDVDGRRLEVFTIPSPGRVEDDDGEIIPASHMNFFIGNATVAVPVYGTASEDAAIAALARLFPARAVVGLRANHVITGGGSFHCITQQQPGVDAP